MGLVSAAAVVAQAIALAGVLASAMGPRPVNALPAAAWLLVASAARAACAMAGEVVAARGSEAVKARLRGTLLGAVMAQAGPAGPSPGEIATIAGRGLDALDPYVGRCLPDLVLAAAVPIALTAVVGGLEWVSAVVIATVLLLFPLFGYLVGASSGPMAARRWRHVEAFGALLADMFEGLPALRALGLSGRQRERIALVGEALTAASLSTLRVAFLSALVLETLASVSVALVAVPLGLRLLDGSVALPAALAVLIIAPEVFLPLRRASSEFHESTEGLAAARRAMDVISAAPPASRPATVPADPARAVVALRSVRVELPGRADPVLDGASLAIAPGETLVVTGANGAGKSTALALLLGFLSPARGSVLVGGRDLRSVDLEAWRRRIAYLPEHPVLLAATLAENLRIADPAATDARLAEALAAAGADDLLAALPDGLASRLGEGGRPVSAGERQRIALARVLLRDASLYLLDEPTAHLDRAAERVAVAALAARLRGRSALVVTHRPGALALAGRVVVLDGGAFGAAERPSGSSGTALEVPA